MRRYRLTEGPHPASSTNATTAKRDCVKIKKPHRAGTRAMGPEARELNGGRGD